MTGLTPGKSVGALCLCMLIQVIVIGVVVVM